MLNDIEQHKLVKILLVIFFIEWLLLAINPHYRSDWLLENVLVVIYFPVMIALRKRVTFSNLSYLLMFIFMFLHAIGAHYTYAEVPYDQWFKMINAPIDTIYQKEGSTVNVKNYCSNMIR